MIENEKLVAFDLETTNGFGRGSLNHKDPNSRVALMQFSFDDGSIFLDEPHEGIDRFVTLLNDGYRFIIHNAFFEFNWLKYKYNIDYDKIPVFCTMTASMLLNSGKIIPDASTFLSEKKEKKNMSFVGYYQMLFQENDDNIHIDATKITKLKHNLQAVAHRYAKVVMEKDQGVSDWARRPLSDDQIRYAKEDVAHLIRIARNQWHYAKKFKMQPLFDTEMNLIKVTTDMMDNGIKIDKPTWRLHTEKSIKIAKEEEVKLNKEIGILLAEKENKPSLFGKPIPKAFMISSNAQLCEFLGVDNVGEDFLKTLDHPLIPRILYYREHAKIVSTYGEKFLNNLDENGRIRTKFQQTKAATGRYTSDSPNVQNIPAETLKDSVRAESGYLPLVIDYSAMESRILAYISKDDGFIRDVNSSDVHWETAKKIFKLPEGATRKEVFNVGGQSLGGDELRRKAKGVNFGIPYGISAVGLVNRRVVDNADEGQDLVDGWYANYPNAKKYLKLQAYKAITDHYTQTPTGRIRWYQIPEGLSQKEKESLESAAARQAQNMPIQSSSADVTKRALVDCYEYLKTTGYGYITLTIHDSIFFEIKVEHISEATVRLLEIMEEAGRKVHPDFNVPAEADVGVKEKRACKITGLKFSVYSHIYLPDKKLVIENPEWVEPRVKKIVGNTNDYNAGFVKLENVLRTQSVEWLKDNHDILEAVKQISSNHSGLFTNK